MQLHSYTLPWQVLQSLAPLDIPVLSHVLLYRRLLLLHHIEGHICANYIEHPDLEPPFLCLVVSGGHTHLVDVKDYGKYEIIGCTRDDAAGEAATSARFTSSPFISHLFK